MRETRTTRICSAAPSMCQRCRKAGRNISGSVWRGNDMNLIVVPRDPGWRGAFEAEATPLLATLKTLALRIVPHGSTAVPGLGAKPIIDIQISVETLEPISAYRDRLETIGYVHVPHPDDSFCPFFHRPH